MYRSFFPIPKEENKRCSAPVKHSRFQSYSGVPRHRPINKILRSFQRLLGESTTWRNLGFNTGWDFAFIPPALVVTSKAAKQETIKITIQKQLRRKQIGRASCRERG